VTKEITPILDPEVVDELVGEWSTETGRKIRRRRKDLNLSLSTVARLAGLSTQTVHRAEYDAASTRDSARYLIATALACDVGDLWTPLTAEQLRRRAKAVA
jgi:transcriptional regulator with XRE-family HTH domain